MVTAEISIVKLCTVAQRDLSCPAPQKGGLFPPFSLEDYFHEVIVFSLTSNTSVIMRRGNKVSLEADIAQRRDQEQQGTQS